MPESPVLTSWKEIAAYLGKGVRTVQRWEEELRLPVRRPYGLDKHVVVALPEELDKWVHERLRPRDNRPPAHAQSDRTAQIERMHRLLQVMQQRTETLQKNVETLQKSATSMAEKRGPFRGPREAMTAKGDTRIKSSAVV
jgi:hypothetical protein